jgi:hypothetical protein
MEMYLTAETTLGHCYTESARIATDSVAAPALFTFYFEDCPIDSNTLEANSNIPKLAERR